MSRVKKKRKPAPDSDEEEESHGKKSTVKKQKGQGKKGIKNFFPVDRKHKAKQERDRRVNARKTQAACREIGKPKKDTSGEKDQDQDPPKKRPAEKRLRTKLARRDAKNKGEPAPKKSAPTRCFQICGSDGS